MRWVGRYKEKYRNGEKEGHHWRRFDKKKDARTSPSCIFNLSNDFSTTYMTNKEYSTPEL
jgi:hypothetical protein